MKLCQCIGLRRLLGCLALAFLLVFASPGWAQSRGTSAADAYAFPYMGPDKSQAQMLEGAFAAQSYLFGAIATGAVGGSSADAGMSALRLLAGFAVLIGAMLFFFNSKYWRMDIIFSWLLLAIIMLFAPFGSKLLFYKVPHVETDRAAFFSPAQSVAGECSANSKGCGLTGQLVAIDVASRLQVAISDIFRSQGWRDLIGEALAREKLKKLNEFTASANWLQDVERFNNKCGRSQDLSSMLAKTRGTTAASDNSTADTKTMMIAPETFGELWNTLRAQYNGKNGQGNLGFDASPPVPIVLYDDQDVQNLGLDVTAYEAGIDKLYKAFAKDGNQATVKVGGGNGGTGSTISVKNALDAIKNDSSFFTVADDSQSPGVISRLFGSGGQRIVLFPGFFIMTKADAEKKTLDDSNPVALRKCYFTKITTGLQPVGNTGCGISSFKATRGLNDPSLHQDNFRIIDSMLRGQAITNNAVWNNFAKVFNTPEFQNMPVGEGRVRIAGKPTVGASTPSSELGNPSSAGYTTTEPEVVEATTQAGMDCSTFGARLVEDAFQQSFVGKFGGTLEASPFGPAGRLLLVAGSIPSDRFLNINDVLTSASQEDANMVSKGEALKSWWNGILRDLNTQSPDVKRRALVENTLELITGNTRSVVLGTDDTQNNAQLDATTVRMGGIDSLTSVGGRLATFFGKALTGLGAIFSGPLAQAVVAFVTILVQLSIMVLIVVTPFLFLAGLVIPTVAMGVITTAVLGAFVLQFVPVTLIVLNYLGGFVYDVVGVTAGKDAWVMQNLIIIGMSGLYMSAVGMTFFLLFKLGDPAAVLGRMAQLDSSAKEMADRGMSTALTAAGIALAATGAGLAGGAAAALKRGASGAANATGLGEAVDAYKRNREQGPPEEGNPAGGDNPVKPDGGAPGTGMAAVSEGLPGEEQTDAERLDVTQEAYDGMVFARSMGLPLEDGFDVNSSGSIVRVDHGERKQEVLATLARGSEVRDVSGGAAGNGGGAPSGDGSMSGAQMKSANAAVDNRALPAAAAPSGDANNAAAAPAGGGAPAAGPSIPPSPGMVRQPAAASNQIVAGPVEQITEEAATSGATLTQRTTSQTQNLGQSDAIVVQSALKKADERLQGVGETDPRYARLKAERDSIAKIDPAAIAQGKHFEVLAKLNIDDKLDNLSVGADINPSFLQGVASGIYGSFAGLFAGAGSIPIIGPALRESINEWQQAPERARAWNAAGGFSKWRQAQDAAARGSFFKKEVAPLVAAQEYNEMLNVGGFQSQISNGRQAASEAVAKSRSAYQTNMLHTAMYDIKDDAGAPRGYMNATELRGLGRMESQSRLSSVLTEATIMQNHSINVQKLQTTADGTLKVEEVPVKFGAMALQDMYSGFAAKGMADTFDDNLIRHYGVFEKRYFRDHKDWEASRNLTSSQDSIRSFVRKDPDADYLVGGHLKMVQGKQKYFEGKGQYENLVGLRNQTALERGDLENRLVETFNRQVSQSGLRNVAQQLVDSGKMNASELSSAGNDAAGEESLAKATKKAFLSANINKRDLSLDAIFEEAYSRGQMTYQSKSRMARVTPAAEQAALQKNIGKALADRYENVGIPRSQLRDRQIGNERSPYKQVLEGLTSALGESFMHIFKKGGANSDTASTLAEKAMLDVAKVLEGMKDDERRDIFQNVRTERGDVANAVHAEKFFNLLNRVQADASASPANSAEYINGLRNAQNEFKAVLKSADGTTDLVMINSANDQLGEEQNWIGKPVPQGIKAVPPSNGKGGNKR